MVLGLCRSKSVFILRVQNSLGRWYNLDLRGALYNLLFSETCVSCISKECTTGLRKRFHCIPKLLFSNILHHVSDHTIYFKRYCISTSFENGVIGCKQRKLFLDWQMKNPKQEIIIVQLNLDRIGKEMKWVALVMYPGHVLLPKSWLNSGLNGLAAVIKWWRFLLTALKMILIIFKGQWV